MPKTIQIAPEIDTEGGQTISFVLAIGSVRQVCRLQTTFRTQNQALSYFHKNRNAYERVAREKLAHGNVEDGVIRLTMLSTE